MHVLSNKQWNRGKKKYIFQKWNMNQNYDDVDDDDDEEGDYFFLVFLEICLASSCGVEW